MVKSVFHVKRGEFEVRNLTKFILFPTPRVHGIVLHCHAKLKHREWERNGNIDLGLITVCTSDPAKILGFIKDQY